MMRLLNINILFSHIRPDSLICWITLPADLTKMRFKQKEKIKRIFDGFTGNDCFWCDSRSLKLPL